MINIHLWFIINLVAVGICLVTSNELRSIFLLVITFSSQLLRKKEEIKEEYTKKLPNKSIFFIFMMVGFLVISAFSGFTKKTNEYVESHPEVSQGFTLFIALMIFVAYFKLIKAKKKASQNDFVTEDLTQGNRQN